MEKPSPPRAPGPFFNQVLNRLTDDGERLAVELDRAKDDFPTLVRTAQLALAYIGYTAANDRLRAAFPRLGGAGYTPWPPEPDGFPDFGQFCPPMPPEMCACMNFDVDACCVIDPELCAEDDELGPAPQVETCESLCQQYEEALECARGFCSRGAISIQESRRWAECQATIEETFARMMEMRCVDVYGIIEILPQLVEARRANIAIGRPDSD